MQNKNRRVVLITGASSGIGLACARYLAARGFQVYGTSRFVSGANHEVEGVTMLSADVTDAASVDRVVAEVLARARHLDIVVNNAGMGIAGPLEATSLEEAVRQFEVNFFGTVRVCRAVLPIMRRQGSGYIVNIGSIGGLIAIPFQSMYSASKFALEGMSESLRMEVREFGVRVVLVEPGDHKTAITQNRQASALMGDAEAYRSSFTAALAKTAHDEQHGPSPEGIARLVHRIVQSRNPRLRYTAGPLPQRAAIWLKRLGPYRAVEFALRKYYGVGNPSNSE